MDRSSPKSVKRDEQQARFLETARALECDEDAAAFDEQLKAVVGPKKVVEPLKSGDKQ